MKKRILVTILLICICCTSFSLPFSVSAKEGVASVTLSTDDNVNFATQKVVFKANEKIKSKPYTFTVNVKSKGLYTIGMSYKAIDSAIDSIEVGLHIDGKAPFEEAENLLFPRVWKDDGGTRVDGAGNEFSAKQILYDKFVLSYALDITRWTSDKYLVDLSAGKHEITIIPKTGAFELEFFEFGIPSVSENYKAPNSNSKFYKGDTIKIETEDSLYKNSYWIAGKSDNSSLLVTPNSAKNTLVNFIGGGNWATPGETIVWETPELEAGYYNLGFNFRQSAILGGKTYRALTIDGKVPFKEAENIGFGYDDGWQQSLFSDEKGEPYLVYLSKGKHEIALSVVPGDMLEVRNNLRDVVSEMGSLYIENNMITGETVDVNRDYDLFTQIPDMEERLKEMKNTLSEIDVMLNKITGKTSGSHSSVLKNAVLIMGQMLNNKYTVHRYKENYYNSYTSLGSVLYELKNMPLDLDKIFLIAPEQDGLKKDYGFFDSLWFSTKKFLVSFSNDYSNISGKSDAKEQVTVWVNWGIDQARALSSLAQNSFTANTGIAVNVKLVNASIVQAILSGRNPDCLLQTGRTEPVNLAMRGVLYDLNNFDDVDEVLKRFHKGAAEPYYYKNGLYGLPDTQTFYMMFYRKDIMEQLGLEIPETWEEFTRVSKLLIRNNLNAYLPTTEMFNTFLMQRGLSLYAEDGRKTNLSSSDVMLTFGEITDYFTKGKLPITMDFYNRFRTGTCPLGITTYTLYTTLKVAASEIDGLWGMAPIPGTVNEDDTVSHVSAGGGTACSILNLSKNKEAAWELIKWWTGVEAQVSYSNEIEAILGPTGRLSVANKEALTKMSWDDGMLKSILKSWDQLQEMPEYPGSYYVSRSVYQAFWNVVNDNENPKDMLLKFSKEADDEIARKWKQYEGRNR